MNAQFLKGQANGSPWIYIRNIKTTFPVMQVSLLLTLHESLMPANNKRGPPVSLAPATEGPTASSLPTSSCRLKTEAEPSLLFMTPPCLAHQKKGRLESWFIVTLSFLGVMQISPPRGLSKAQHWLWAKPHWVHGHGAATWLSWGYHFALHCLARTPKVCALTSGDMLRLLYFATKLTKMQIST